MVGSPRLYERDDPSGQYTIKETPGYRWRYDHGENQAGPSTFIEMTVSVEGDVQLSSGSTSYFPATPEGFAALLEEWDNKCNYYEYRKAKEEEEKEKGELRELRS
ncbi:hypothetical protein NLG97_g5038 [Lecanicillium saksenae]|uniref:Uncharacterized protein n=1 Tax=Lecanicillium saksenae TaxID=468837 RepID=A0ACC1QVG7_9HYPO|nr:hypothetical protein NLG97_g5038 [Lecanicillium saksenae]